MSIDETYQQAVDAEADKLLQSPAQDILTIGTHGIIGTTINGEQTSVSWWHYQYEGGSIHQIVFLISRIRFNILPKIYLSGVKAVNGQVMRLTELELKKHRKIGFV